MWRGIDSTRISPDDHHGLSVHYGVRCGRSLVNRRNKTIHLSLRHTTSTTPRRRHTNARLTESHYIPSRARTPRPQPVSGPRTHCKYSTSPFEPLLACGDLHVGCDVNQVSQQNVFYTDLHARANEEGDAMSKSFKENYQVHPRGDGALTKELSNKGMAHKAEMEKLHRKASEWIFTRESFCSRASWLYALMHYFGFGTENNIVRSGNVPCRFIGSDVLNTATRAGEQPSGSRLAWSLCERSHIFHGTIHPRGPKARTHRTPSYSRYVCQGQISVLLFDPQITHLYACSITPEFLGEGLHLRNGATKIKFVTIEELMSKYVICPFIQFPSFSLNINAFLTRLGTVSSRNWTRRMPGYYCEPGWQRQE